MERIFGLFMLLVTLSNVVLGDFVAPDRTQTSGGDNLVETTCIPELESVKSITCFLAYNLWFFEISGHSCALNKAYGAKLQNDFCNRECNGYFTKNGLVVTANDCCPAEKLIPVNECKKTCSTQRCPKYPTATCRLERCNMVAENGQCEVKFYVAGKYDVTNLCHA